LVAVTVIFKYQPRSPETIVYVEVSAPAIEEYVPPEVEARLHWYEYEVGVLLQVPLVALTTCPGLRFPEITGTTEFAGTAVL
jgi:hypothetical protein